MSVNRILAAVAGLSVFVSSAVFAADVQQVEAPELPAALESGEPLDGEVSIREESHEIVYEYRRNGQLFLVKVQPKGRGVPPYYFYDQNGDGNLQYSPNDPTSAMNVNMWRLFSW